MGMLMFHPHSARLARVRARVRVSVRVRARLSLTLTLTPRRALLDCELHVIVVAEASLARVRGLW